MKMKIITKDVKKVQIDAKILFKLLQAVESRRRGPQTLHSQQLCRVWLI